MSSVASLLARLCPDGVPYEALGNLGSIFGGLTGKAKADFAEGNARYVSYSNVYEHLAVDTDANDRVRIEPGERQRQLARGDVLFTGSSETRDEVGISAVVTADLQEPVYLNSFCIGFRLHDAATLNPEFAKYLFRSADMRRQIIGTASGVTRYNVSKARLARVKVPIPPAEVQAEIAKTLDRYASLEQQLEHALEQERRARTSQYNFYRDALLSVGSDTSSRTAAMGELGTFIRGRRFTKKDVVESGIPSIHYGEIYTHYGVAAAEAISQVRRELAPQLRFAQPGDVVIAAVGETVEDVAKAVAWLGDQPVAIHDDTFLFRGDLNPKYVSYAMQTSNFHAQKNRYVARAKVKRLSGESLAKIRIPVPPRAEQDRVVAILDNFSALLSEIAASLPAERQARRTQYTHYRDRLLTFKEAVQ